MIKIIKEVVCDKCYHVISYSLEDFHTEYAPDPYPHYNVFVPCTKCYNRVRIY